MYRLNKFQKHVWFIKWSPKRVFCRDLLDLKKVDQRVSLTIFHLQETLSIIHTCSDGVRYFSKGDFPSDNFPTGNFPNVQFPKWKLPKGQVRPSEATHAAIEGPSTVARMGQGAKCLGQNRLGAEAQRLGQTWKVAAWEIAIWENTLWKLPLGKIPFGKVQHPLEKPVYTSVPRM